MQYSLLNISFLWVEFNSFKFWCTFMCILKYSFSSQLYPHILQKNYIYIYHSLWTIKLMILYGCQKIWKTDNFIEPFWLLPRQLLVLHTFIFVCCRSRVLASCWRCRIKNTLCASYALAHAYLDLSWFTPLSNWTNRWSYSSSWRRIKMVWK